MPLTTTYLALIPKAYYTVQYNGALKRRPDFRQNAAVLFATPPQKLQCIWAMAVNQGVTISAIDFSCVLISTMCYLTIIPRARMGSESIAHEAEGWMGYWLRGHEGERNNCFSKIQLVGQKYRDKTTLASKTRFSRHCFGFQSRRFSLLVGYNI